MAISEISGLDQQQAIDKVLTFSNSDYFKEYRCKGKIISNYLSVDSLGGFDSENELGEGFTLEDVKPGLESILNVMKDEPKAKLLQLFLNLYAPQNVRKRAGFTRNEGDNLTMSVDVFVSYDRVEDNYQFKVFSSHLREENYSESEFRKLKPKYDLWIKEIREEVAKCLEDNSQSNKNDKTT